MSTHTNPISAHRLLPLGWHRAPLAYWQTDAKDSFIFLCLNLFLGTCGLWIPILIGPLFGQSLGTAANSLLMAGTAYLFVIPFLASICYSVVETHLRAEEGGARKQYFVYIIVIVVLCILAALLIPSQIYGNNSATTALFVLQIVFSLAATLVGIYVFFFLKLDTSQSLADDMNKKAQVLSDTAASAPSDRSDFES